MFCKFCGVEIDNNVVVCTKCGRQVQELRTAPNPQFQQPFQQQPNIIINNTNTNTNAGMGMIKPKNKWVALLLCFFLGFLGAHKFYEGKILLGIVYIVTFGLFGIGAIIDFIILLFKPNPYY